VIAAIGILAGPGYARIDPGSIVGLWLLDEDEGDEVRDSSENGHNGIAVDGQLEWVDGKFGSALEVAQGVGARVHVEHHDAFNLETFTLMAWVNFHATGSNQDIALKQTTNDDRNYQIQKNASDKARSSFASGGQRGAGSVTSATTIIDGVWYHIAATYDMTEFRMYLNGVLEGTTQLAIEPDNNTNPFSIGAHPTGGNVVNGLVDEVALFSVALEEEDIQAIMNEGLEKALSLTAVSSKGKLTTVWGQVKAEQ
jgi:hypothetical protein